MALASKSFSEIVTFTRASSAGYYGSDGLYKTAASGVARMDYNPATLAARGLLIEAQGTNLLLQSQDISAAAFTPLNLNTTGHTNLVAAPDGTTTMDAVMENTTPSAFHGLNQTITKAASSIAYAFSAFVKPKGRDVVMALQTVGGGSGVAVRFSPTTGVVTGAIGAFGTGFTVGIAYSEALPGGAYRLTMTAKSDTATTLVAQISLHNGTTQTYTGDGSSGVYVWGLQLEEGTYSTSYIPTTTAQVTRLVDRAEVTNLSPWYNQSAGTVLVEGVRRTIPAPASGWGAYGRFFTVNDGTVNNQYSCGTVAGLSAVYTAITAAGAETMDYAALNMTANAVTKCALALTATSARMALNGALAGASDDTSVILPAATRLTIGGRSDGSQETAWSGWIRSVRYYPRRVTNAELVSLTT